ncbi:hypothetical protein E2F47_01830 [Mycobacterium eburneum]|nr:hypothetical protein [Mycobacterium eburneum]TDH57534.1 hypothetical protein E2F47_01830 [Mycobacterium eburneum]
MSAPDTAVLAALDWQTITCQCSGHECERPAIQQVEIHAVDHCGCPGTNAFGNVVELLCGECGLVLRVQIEMQVRQMAMLGRPYCATCRARIAVVGDVLRAVKAL